MLPELAYGSGQFYTVFKLFFYVLQEPWCSLKEGHIFSNFIDLETSFFKL